ncbi:SGNH/GDSL hydrolase family protein [Actinokineospora auranticolor]|uniref:Lysophospholipase L1-like esterase n=1 Tax=Actinokineospora auranticolor TaxID=155976 RepID=A0A2S6GI50_9PSEU|nr:SGNH/GDSL hydrolase family protein [Actinokineospora auranticolor]PPK64904.1 lysophospholipase L1-like esterase [Actinokineospora auranticolor]
MPVRLLTLGDSFAEGRGDPRPDGTFGGWVPPLAESLGIAPHEVVNTGAYMATTQDVIDHQLARALSADAPLYGVTVGGNDLVRSSFDEVAFRRNLRHILGGLGLRGARVFTINWPDIPGKLPGLAPAQRQALRARFAAANDFMDKLTAELGVVRYDMVDTPLTRDPAMWGPDGMHPSPAGHRAIAAGFAELLS